MRIGRHIYQQLLLAPGCLHHQLLQLEDCVLHQLTLMAGHDDQPPHVEGRIYRQLLQKAGCVQYQLLMAAGRTHFHAAADGDMCFPSTTTLGRGTSSPPATMDSEMFSPPTNADSGLQEATSHHGGGGCPGVASQQGDGHPQ